MAEEDCEGDRSLKQPSLINVFQFVQGNMIFLCEKRNDKLDMKYFVIDDANVYDDTGSSSQSQDGVQMLSAL